MAKRKRQYNRDLIRVSQRDIDTSINRTGKEWWGIPSRVQAFASDGCPILTSLRRHGHRASFNTFYILVIDGKIYSAPQKMVDWQKRGAYNRGKTAPFSFRISELSLF
jgi:hypothetical protein